MVVLPGDVVQNGVLLMEQIKPKGRKMDQEGGWGGETWGRKLESS